MEESIVIIKVTPEEANTKIKIKTHEDAYRIMSALIKLINHLAENAFEE